jgi:uncharacterized protein (DUF2141 family)
VKISLPKMSTFAALLALLAGVAPAQQPDQCVVIVSLYWPGHDLTHSQVRVFRDAQHQDLVGAFPATDAEGKVLMAVAPGMYYLTAVVDTDNDGKLSAGDGLGFYGVLDPKQERPAPVEIKEKAFAIWIPISLVMGADGKLTPTGVTKPAPPPPPKSVTLSGQVTGLQATGLTVVYAVPKSGQGACYAALPAPEKGDFALQVAAGEYYLFAVQDVNETEKVEAGDLMAVFGYTPGQGRNFPTARTPAISPWPCSGGLATLAC